MKLVKKINNNFAIGIDKAGNSVIVSGKGVGFGEFPRNVDDLTEIDRSYYDVSNRFIGLIKSIPEDIILSANKIVNYAEQQLGRRLNPNFVFTLADHLNYSITKKKEGIVYDYGVTYEVKYLHPEEIRISKAAIRYLEKKYNLVFSQNEVAIVAMHILEAENYVKKKEKKQENKIDTDKVIKDITEIVKQEMHISVNEEEFNYYRFATHTKYLLDRMNSSSEIQSVNKDIYLSIKNNFPTTYKCVEKIKQYLREKMNVTVGDEETLYLMLHINRLCAKEDCNNKA